MLNKKVRILFIFLLLIRQVT